jgi:6-phosphogluconolactonase/glucosamine-6-phosphate isomerase/deaminase
MSPKIPATILKTHPDWHWYLDSESAEKVFPV